MNLLLTSSSWSSLATRGLTLEFLDGGLEAEEQRGRCGDGDGIATRLTLEFLDGLEAEEEQRGRCGDGDEIFFIVSISLSFFLSLSLSRLIFNI